MAVVNLDIADIFEEAYEQAGQEMRGGYDLRRARRTFNLLTHEWANKGLNLWTIEQNTQAITTGTATYTLTETDTIDLLEHVIRDSNSKDYNLTRMSVSEYAKHHDKTIRARPTKVYVDRAATNTKVTLWPTPDAAYTLVYWRLSGIDGLSSGAGSGTNADVPVRFVPALVAGLAYHIAVKGDDLNRAALLKQRYDELFMEAAEEDRSRASTMLVPRVR